MENLWNNPNSAQQQQCSVIGNNSHANGKDKNNKGIRGNNGKGSNKNSFIVTLDDNGSNKCRKL